MTFVALIVAVILLAIGAGLGADRTLQNSARAAGATLFAGLATVITWAALR